MRPVIFAALLFSPAMAAAATVPAPYVDSVRVRTHATEQQREDTKYQADRAAAEQKINEAAAAARSAKPQDQAPAWARVRELQEGLQKRAEDSDAAFAKRLGEVIAKLRVSRHLAPVAAGPGLILVPGTDVTDDALKVWNAMDGQALAAKVDELQRQLADRPAPETTAPAPASKPAPPPARK